MDKNRLFTALKLLGCIALIVVINHLYLRPIEAEAREQAQTQLLKRQEMRESLRIVPGERLGHVALGESLDKALLKLGKPDFQQADPGLALYFDQGIEMHFSEGKVIRLTAHGRTGRGYEYFPYPGTTAEGISVGSTRSELIAAYGEPARIEYGDYVYEQPPMTVSLDRNDRISSITLQ